MLLKRKAAGSLAPIEVVMAFCRRAFEAQAMAFERKAGSPFINIPDVSLQKNYVLFVVGCLQIISKGNR